MPFCYGDVADPAGERPLWFVLRFFGFFKFLLRLNGSMRCQWMVSQMMKEDAPLQTLQTLWISRSSSLYTSSLTDLALFNVERVSSAHR